MIILFFIYQPLINFTDNNPIPDDNIFPSEEDKMSGFSSTIEDLQLMIFKKDQKIKFRDRRIDTLTSNIKELKINYENIKSEFNNLEEKYYNYVKVQKSKKTIEVDPEEINNLNSKIKLLTEENKSNNFLMQKLKSDLDKIIITNKLNINDNEALKNEYKNIVSQNIKLSNLINNLETIIENQKKEIKSLEDQSHHNQ